MIKVRSAAPAGVKGTTCTTQLEKDSSLRQPFVSSSPIKNSECVNQCTVAALRAIHIERKWKRKRKFL